MFQDFSLFFVLGWQHILDWQGYDHILFVTVLCGIYTFRDWRRVLWLVTAFTLGHSLTLALSLLELVRLNQAWIEFLIPVTILLTAVFNIGNKTCSQRSLLVSYGLTFFFGLIHGLGFSNYLRSLLGAGTNILGELLAFNMGLEAGQITIVLIILFSSWLALDFWRVQRREWNLVLSSVILGIAALMALERLQTL